MAVKNPPFVVRRGDDLLVEVQVYDVDGRPSNLSATPILITYGTDPTQGIALVSRTQDDAGISVAVGKIRMRMRSAETMNLDLAKTYWLKVRVVFADYTETVAVGSFSAV